MPTTTNVTPAWKLNDEALMMPPSEKPRLIINKEDAARYIRISA
jgi:hypothetical protein